MPQISLTLKTSAGRRLVAGIVILTLLNGVALYLLFTTEVGAASTFAAILAWALLNLVWIGVFRRPAVAAVLSLTMLSILMVLSIFKHAALTMTVTFTDILVIDKDTFSFLMQTFPNLDLTIALYVILALVILPLVWWLDPFRVRRAYALIGALSCFVLLAGFSFLVPLDREDEFLAHNYLSKFARSGAVTAVDIFTTGVLEADTEAVEALATMTECKPPAKLPHIIMIFDESSFDASTLPGIKVPANYQSRFRSFDGKQRNFIVEGAGGPSWFTEYNVLSGLSARSYGRFAQAVTRLATGRVERGLPRALQRCGYRTFSFYPFSGAFLGARGYQTTTGIENFYDMHDIKGFREPDAHYYDFAARTISQELGHGPLFLFVYTAANHFPWSFRYRPDLLRDWRNLGNRPDVDEYLRRQEMSARDYPRFIDRLKRSFPNESFLIVRFGDHQPLFAKEFVDPTLDAAGIAKRIQNFDLRYFTTYYAVDTIAYNPAELSSALDTLDAPYLPLVVLEAAGVPLDASFVEQKKILQRCRGMFYLCRGGAEARRFNRLLIDAGLIRGL